MKFYSKNQKIRFMAMLIVILSLSFLLPGSTLNASDNLEIINHSYLTVTKMPETETNEYFSLVETRIIDAELLDDQMLEDISPSLVAPVTVEISSMLYQQEMMQGYNQSVCFKQCHSKNDFSVSDYTFKQWCQLIEEEGHSIFSEIPWENTGDKEKLIKYLTRNAKKASFESAGIGEWDSK
jgi:hypothetical protein